MAKVFHLYEPEHEAWSPIPGQPVVTLLDLDRGRCSWPVTGGFCGAGTETSPDGHHRTWCPTHHKRGVTPLPTKKATTP